MKKLVAMVMSLTLTCTCLAGCGKKAEKNTDDDMVTLTWYTHGTNQSDSQMVYDKFNELTKEKLGIKVDFQTLDAGAYAERMTMNMASGNTFDLCFTGYINPYEDAVRKGGLMELDALLEEAPALKNAVSSYLWDASRINGKIYAVPNEQIAATSTALFVKKDLADKFNLDKDSIKQTSDIEPFLKVLKENEPGIYPFRPNWGIRSIDSLDANNYWEKSVSSAVGSWVGLDGSVTPMTVDQRPDYLEKANLLWDWYQKGYIRKDIASVMDEAQEMKNGKFGVWLATYKPGVEVSTKASLGYDVVVIPVSQPVLTTSGVTSAMTAIGKNSKHPKEAIKLLELVNTEPEAINLLTHGIEGVHYTKLSDTTIKQSEDANFSSAAWIYGSQFLAYTTEREDPEVWKKTKKMNEEAIKSSLLGFSFDSSKVKNEISQCESVLKEYKVIDNGSENPASYYDKFVQRLNEVGMDKILEEYKLQVEAFLAAK